MQVCISAHTWWFNRLGVGVWIVLGIIILVIAIIVGYCIYQKKCGKSEEYQQPNEQKQAEQQQNPVWFKFLGLLVYQYKNPSFDTVLVQLCNVQLGF